MSKAVDSNTGDIENIFARNKRDSEDGDATAMLIAKYFLRESASQKRSLTRPASARQLEPLADAESAKKTGRWHGYSTFCKQQLHQLYTIYGEDERERS